MLSWPARLNTLCMLSVREPLTQYPEQETDNLLMIYASFSPGKDGSGGGMPYPGVRAAAGGGHPCAPWMLSV